MAKVEVEAQQDHIERVAASKTPVQAVGELVWNAVDGDATDVRVDFVENKIGGVDEIQVTDNGDGFSHALAREAFRKLGASWKKGRLSPTGRRLHGQAGEGRFSAFALGTQVRWVSRCKEGNKVKRFEIKGDAADLRSFDVGEPVEVADPRTGVEVIVRNIDKVPRSLLGPDTAVRFAQIFAIYLRRYPKVTIRIAGVVVDPASVEDHVEDYPIEGVLGPDGNAIAAELTVIEWKHKVDRELVLCDAAGFALDAQPAGIHAKGYDFTAYLKSDYLRDCANRNVLAIGEMVPEIDALTNSAKALMRAHFRKRAAESARAVVEAWKKEEVYPYAGEPRDKVETVERQVFDVVALNINQYLPEFSEAAPRWKKVSLQMVRTALERSPSDLRRIFEEALALPKEKREELLRLIERTSFTSIINASKLVVERTDFLSGLEVVLFDYEAKKKLKERQHLQHLVAENTWILGEAFHLTVDDQSLTEVLRRHIHLLDRDRQDLAPVLTADGEKGIVDIMISKRLPQPLAVEHLVVELKRPIVKIDNEVLGQLKKYAHAIHKDERFRDTGARWNFWALSNEIHDEVRWELEEQRDKPAGCALDVKDMRLWVKTWGQVIEDARGRLKFLSERLNVMADLDIGLEHIQEMYAKYLPPELVTDADDEDDVGAPTAVGDASADGAQADLAPPESHSAVGPADPTGPTSGG